MKILLFIVSAATFAIWSGVEIVNVFDPLPTRVIYFGEVPDKTEPLISDVIEAARVRHGLPKGIIEGVIFTESSFNEKARNPERSLCGQMSAKGWKKSDCESRGLMGIVYGWHKDGCGLDSPTDLFNPRININCGAAILKQKIRLAKGDVSRGLGFYNNDKTGRYSAKVMKLAKKFARGRSRPSLGLGWRRGRKNVE